MIIVADAFALCLLFRSRGFPMEPRPSTGSQKEKALLGADVPRRYSCEWLILGYDPFVPRGTHPERIPNSHYQLAGPRQ